MVWAILAAAAITTMGTLPIFLLSAQAVLVQQELGFTEFQLGMAATAFFTAAALGSIPAGRAAMRFGRRTSATGAGLLATASLLGIALVPPSYPLLLVFVVLGGLANAAGQVSANVLLAEAVPNARQGLAFGLKQSAIPIATLLGGLAVPTIGLTLGWRWAYVGAATLAMTVAVVAPTVARGDHGAQRSPAGGKTAATAPLVVIAIATGLASAATNALGAYLVIWSVQVGVAPGHAGLLLACASALSIAARVASGAAADRRGRRNLPVVAAQLCVGAVSLVLLATGGTTALVVGALIAFGIGWSWPGLLLFAVVRIGRGSPAVATSIIQAGAFIGGAAGPGLFGLLVHVSSFVTAWRAAAGSMLLAAVLIVIGRRMLLIDLAPQARRTARSAGSAEPRNRESAGTGSSA